MHYALNPMKHACLLLLALLALVAGAAPVAPTDSAVLWVGRTAVTPEGAVKFNYPGVTARLRFEGPTLGMLTSPGSGYFVVEVDEQPARKVFYGPADSFQLLAEGLGDGPHEARITYAVEGYEYKPEIREFVVDRLLEAPEPGKLKIEFIGNSITCGYGTEADGADKHFTYDTENHLLTYAHLTAMALGADAQIVARSGIGAYRNYNGPREGSPDQTMPLEYDRTMLYEPAPLWDFSSWRPDIVCINLGTNDTSTNNYDIARFEKAYSNFLDHVMEMNPGAKIVLLSGSMLNGKELEDVTAALNSVAASHPGVYRFDMTPLDPALGYGADYHPSARQAIVMARELTAFLRSIL